jgi:hypothetical protein
MRLFNDFTFRGLSKGGKPRALGCTHPLLGGKVQPLPTEKTQIALVRFPICTNSRSGFKEADRRGIFHDRAKRQGRCVAGKR